jgi:hypothetical protein
MSTRNPIPILILYCQYARPALLKARAFYAWLEELLATGKQSAYYPSILSRRRPVELLELLPWQVTPEGVTRYRGRLPANFSLSSDPWRPCSAWAPQPGRSAFIRPRPPPS